MIIRGILIPIWPIIAGALAVPIGLSIVSTDLRHWELPAALVSLLTCSIWWAAPMFIGAVYGGFVGVITGLVFYDEVEQHGEVITILGTCLTMLGVGITVWLIKFL